MVVEFAPGFVRFVKKLHSTDQVSLKETTRRVIDYYTGAGKTLGLGLRHLRGEIWEAREGLRRRVIYRLSRDKITFILAGNHDDIRSFLRHL
jgi:hypothetical protein